MRPSVSTSSEEQPFFQNRGEEWSVLFSRGAMGGLNMLTILNDGHIDTGIFRKANLSPSLGIGSDSLHGHAVREYAVVANLVDLCVRQLQAGRKLTLFVTQISEANEFVGGEKMSNAIRKVLGNKGCVVRESF